MMSHIDPVDGSDRRNLNLDLEGPFVVDYPEPKISLTQEATDQLIVSVFNVLNAVATFAWTLLLLTLALAVPITVGVWRAVF